MKIVRHSVNAEYWKAFFAEESKRLLARVDYARKQTRSLSSLGMIAELTYRAGSVVAPGSPEVASAIRLAAQANTAILLFGRIETPPRYCRIGDGPPVTYLEPVDESHVHGGRWVEAFFQTTISRQADLRAALIEVPTDLLRQSSTRGGEAANHWDDLHRAIWTDPHFTRHPAFQAFEDYCVNCLPRTAHGIAVQRLTVPYLQVLKQLEGGDEIGFSTALLEALQLHKKYWNSTEARRKNLEGVVSLQLTAAAALAWDRGMRFDVESDYMPASWVCGDIFRDFK